MSKLVVGARVNILGSTLAGQVGVVEAVNECMGWDGTAIIRVRCGKQVYTLYAECVEEIKC